MSKIGVEFDVNGNYAGDVLEDQEIPETHTLYEGDIKGKYKYLPFFNGTDVVEKLTQSEIDAIENAPEPPDPDAELATAIQNATTLDELKTALIGGNGKASAKGRIK